MPGPKGQDFLLRARRSDTLGSAVPTARGRSDQFAGSRGGQEAVMISTMAMPACMKMECAGIFYLTADAGRSVPSGVREGDKDQGDCILREPGRRFCFQHEIRGGPAFRFPKVSFSIFKTESLRLVTQAFRCGKSPPSVPVRLRYKRVRICLPVW